MKEFNLGKNLIGDHGGEKLGDMLEYSRTVIKFSLYHNNLGDKTAIAISKGLTYNQHIEEINLRKNLINLRYIHVIDSRCKAIKERKAKSADAGAEFEVKKRELMNTLAELRQQDKEKKHQERRFEKINVALNEERQRQDYMTEKLDTKINKLSVIEDHDR